MQVGIYKTAVYKLYSIAISSQQRATNKKVYCLCINLCGDFQLVSTTNEQSNTMTCINTISKYRNSIDMQVVLM